MFTVSGAMVVRNLERTRETQNGAEEKAEKVEQEREKLRRLRAGRIS